MNSVLRRAPVLGSIDVPGGHSAVSRGPLTVSGWAVGVFAPVSRVELFLEGRLLGRAGLNRPRADVAAALGDDAAELSGFEFRLDLRRIQLARETARLDARVTLLDGTAGDLEQVKIALGPAREGLLAPERAGLPPRFRKAGRIRLLCSARSLDYGGSQLRMREFAEHVQANGRFDMTVMSPVEGPLRRDLEAAGMQVLLAPFPIDDAAMYEEKLASLAAWAAGRFDVVMATTLTSFPAVDLAERLGLPSLWRIGEAEPLHVVVEWLGGRLDPEVELKAHNAFATASVVFFNSQAGLKLCRESGIEGPFAVLGSGTNVAGASEYIAATDREAIRQSLGIPPDRLLLICAGTLWPIKAQATLVAALQHAVVDHPQLECVLIGSHAELYSGAIRRLIERRGLARSIRLLPFSGDLRPWWRAADAAVCPSESESMPAAVLEAMSFGLPVLASRVGGVPEIVKDGTTGWLCEPGDLGSLIAGLKRVATANAEERQALGENAAWLVHNQHDRRAALSNLTDLIENVARGSQPRWLRKQLAKNRSKLRWRFWIGKR